MTPPPVLTNSQGQAITNPPYATQRIGKHGPLLLQDIDLIDNLAHFDRERIPERVVHGRGSGAHGVFEVTDDITDVCSADFLSQVGKKTRTFTRFSLVAAESGANDSARDVRGFATKFYTSEGILDFVYIHTPVFFIRDPSKFVDVNHVQKRNPQTNSKDPNAAWDFFTLNPETIHQVTILYTDRGTPASFRHMHGFSAHTFKWSNAKGEWVYVRIHQLTDQGIKNHTIEEATRIAGENPDAAQDDLFQSIDSGDYPSWTCYVQTMTPEQAKNAPFSVFDMTKTWPHRDYPLRRFGKLTLNENPENYFAEVEQAAFSPANTVPSMQPSADPVLQGRLFSYTDTQRYRLGVNFAQIPVNCPLRGGVQPFTPSERDGFMNVNGNLGKTPNYLTKRNNVTIKSFPIQQFQEVWEGPAEPFEWVATPAEFDQPAILYNEVLSDVERRNLAHNVSIEVAKTEPDIQDRVFKYFGGVSPELAEAIKKEVFEVNPRK
ncbi:CTA1 [Candida metapsilosis]|uniref:Catalase n=1 Tax=Candida metapsilosis TaxID=273372 RepID=A0A8H7ZJT9_9ASCO|nr:CTA1 [Candida metapsilosis]